MNESVLRLLASIRRARRDAAAAAQARAAREHAQAQALEAYVSNLVRQAEAELAHQRAASRTQGNMGWRAALEQNCLTRVEHLRGVLPLATAGIEKAARALSEAQMSVQRCEQALMRCDELARELRRRCLDARERREVELEEDLATVPRRFPRLSDLPVVSVRARR
jgi:hypothetical protein